MPAPAPFASSPAQPLPYPALYLYPLNDSFVPKHIALSHGQHVKIGRQTNAKTAPGERNGYFDSKVLSRQHAEVWEENGKIFIKDVKSSNGTFINGERLSIEAVESDPYELKSDDIVEFGIDIVGEDNKTIIHHKVAARVLCVFTEQDAQVAARAEQHQAHAAAQAAQQQQQHPQNQHPAHPHQQYSSSSSFSHPNHLSNPNAQGHLGVGGPPTGFNFNNAQQRRPQLSQASLGSMGNMAGMRPAGKSGLTFDVILNRLQGELQKSRETGAELNTLTGAMTEIHETLSGGLPANIPPYPSVLPPVQASQQPPAQAQDDSSAAANQPGPPAAAATSPSQPQPQPQPPSTVSQPPPASASAVPVPPTVITDLQSQLRDTQASLAAQLEKIRMIEEAIAGKARVNGLDATVDSSLRNLNHDGSNVDGGGEGRTLGGEGRSLEEVWAGQESVREEVRVLRDLVEGIAGPEGGGRGTTRRRPVRRGTEPRGGFEFELDGDLGDLEEHGEHGEEEHGEDVHDDDDVRSVGTIIPHELESVEEVDEEGHEGVDEHHEQEQHEQERNVHHEQERPSVNGVLVNGINGVHGHELDEPDSGEVVRPRTPEPIRDGAEKEEEDEEGEEEEGANAVPVPATEKENTKEQAAASSTTKAPAVATEGTKPETVDADVSSQNKTPSTDEASQHKTPSTDEDVSSQIALLSAQVRTVLELTTSLEQQHAAAQATIRALEKKVGELEKSLREPAASGKERDAGGIVSGGIVSAGGIGAQETSLGGRERELEVQEEDEEMKTREESAKAVAVGKAQAQSEDVERETLTERITEWMKSVEGKWNTVQEEWNLERERLGRAREEWEARVRASAIDHAAYAHPVGNGDVMKLNGLVTPPSPRSQSSDSGYRRRRRRSRSASRGRSGSRLRETENENSEHSANASAILNAGVNALATPEPSVYKLKVEREREEDVKEGGLIDKMNASTSPTTSTSNADADSPSVKTHPTESTGVHVNVQTAVGVLLLSVAAAAVIWKVKPE